MAQRYEAHTAREDLKTRFRAKSERMRGKPTVNVGRDRKPQGKSALEHIRPTESRQSTHALIAGKTLENAPALPLPGGSTPPPKAPKDEMQDYLDDLLT